MSTAITVEPPQPTQPTTPGITGWVDFSGGIASDNLNLATMVSGLNTQRELHHVIAPGYGCAATAPVFCSEDSITGVIIGSPRWTDPQLADIARDHGHSAALASAYTEHGEQLTNVIRGSFTFAIVDSSGQSVLLSIDRMGRYPLYYHHNDREILFGTSADSILQLQGAKKHLRSQSIYDYVYFHMVPSPTPIFEGLQKLQAGCLVHLKDREERSHRYWIPEFREKSEFTRETMHRQLKAKLQQAVVDNLPETGKVGAFLSGGLDSSTVTGMLAEVSSGPCNAYSIGFSAEGYDEMAYARITAEHFGANLHEYYVTPEDVVSALPLIATSYDEPFGNSSALPAYFCARMAKQDGVSLLLAGDGGDEIFAGNERYAMQRVFEAYQGVPEWLRSGFLEPLVRHAPGWLPFGEKSRSYIKQANTRLPDRLQTYNFLHRFPASEIFQREFLDTINVEYPLELQRDIYNAPPTATSLNRMLFLDWQYTLADNDLRKVSHMCSVAGVDVAYPMLDDDLVEFSLSVPSQWKLHKGKLRDFYKNALKGWLPDITLSKKKQGFGLPFGVWMQTHKPLQEIAYDNVTKLKSRNIFNPEFLDKSIKLHREGHAAYFGELIWILTVLELWMDEHL